MAVSLRKLGSSRANAKLSTGPRSAVGRRRSSQNARRHGLNVPLLSHRHLAIEVARLAAEIAGATNDPTVRIASQRVALALVELERIEGVAHAITSRCCGEGQAPLELEKLSILLQRLDRYKKRALANRRKAIKRFGLARQASDVASLKTDKTKPRKPIESTLEVLNEGSVGIT